MENRQGLRFLFESIIELRSLADAGYVLTQQQQKDIYKFQEQLSCAQSLGGHHLTADSNGKWFCTNCEYEVKFDSSRQTVDRIGLWPNSDTRTFTAEAGTCSATICSAFALGPQGGLLPARMYPGGGIASFHGKTGKSFEDRLAQQDGSDYNHESVEDQGDANMSWIGDFNNASGLEFTDISSEDWRIYVFISPESTPFDVTIGKPLKLNVSESGGHRIWDAQGISHYIPKGWTHLRWKAREGQPHFIK